MKNKDYYILVTFLCFSSGFINILTVYYFGYTISHFSGTLTDIGKDFLNYLLYHKILDLFVIIVFFLMGVIFVSLISDDIPENNINRYSQIIIFFALLLLIMSIFFNFNKIILFLLTFSMGFQNGMFLKFNGSTLRTTHMSGNLTEFGSHLGKLLKGKKGEVKYILLYLLEIFQYVLGGGIATYMLISIEKYTLIFYA